MRVLSVKFVLFVTKTERAVAFYRDVLGFTPVMENRYWSEVVLGGVTLGLHGGGPDGYRKSGLSIQVDDLEAACEAVVANGGVLRTPPQSRPNEPLALAHVIDPEGNGFDLVMLI